MAIVAAINCGVDSRLSKPRASRRGNKIPAAGWAVCLWPEELNLSIKPDNRAFRDFNRTTLFTVGAVAIQLVAGHDLFGESCLSDTAQERPQLVSSVFDFAEMGNFLRHPLAPPPLLLLLDFKIRQLRQKLYLFLLQRVVISVHAMAPRGKICRLSIRLPQLTTGIAKSPSYVIGRHPGRTKADVGPT